MIHLDTSFLIGALIPGSREDARLREWIGANEPLGMSTVAWAEFLCGPVDETALSVASVVVGRQSRFTEEMAAIAARLFNGSGRRRGTMFDCMIAATALAEGSGHRHQQPGRLQAVRGFRVGPGVADGCSGRLEAGIGGPVFAVEARHALELRAVGGHQD